MKEKNNKKVDEVIDEIVSPEELKKSKEEVENNDELTLLKQELEKTQKENINLLKEVQNYKKQIDDYNENYIKKIKEKQDEVQKILNEKQEELIALNATKLDEFKTKLFTKDILDLIETIEQFNKIINIPNDNQQIQNFLFGFKMFSNMFENSLANMGIQKVNIELGTEPNYDFVEVIETTSNKNHESGKISEIVSNGYKYKDKVIKFAKVKVEQ